MTRGPAQNTIVVRPRNDVYTALAVIGFLIVLAALIIVIQVAKDLLPPSGIL